MNDTQNPAFSVVIPALNEAEAIRPLLEEIFQALEAYRPFEVVVVDDGSTDETAAVVEALAEGLPGLRLVRNDRRRGQSAALRLGAREARSGWIVTMDGDGQNHPADVPKLFETARSAPGPRPALVGGLRLERKDTLSKRWASKAANALRQWMLRDDCRDTGCALKLIERAAFLSLPYFDALHRYLPALMRAHGYATVFVPVAHRARTLGRSKYGNWKRALIGAVDLLGVYWLIRRAHPSPPPPLKPLLVPLSGQSDSDPRSGEEEDARVRS